MDRRAGEKHSLTSLTLAAKSGASGECIKVLVDTSVWSLALRRPSNATLTAEQQACICSLSELVADGRAVLIGPIRQELLSGVKTVSQFEALRESLTAFDNLALSIFTLDMDFVRYQSHLPISLYSDIKSS